MCLALYGLEITSVCVGETQDLLFSTFVERRILGAQTPVIQ